MLQDMQAGNEENLSWKPYYVLAIPFPNVLLAFRKHVPKLAC